MARRIAPLPALVLAWLLAAGAAHAARVDPGGFRLASSSLVVHENAGQAVIAIERSDVRREAQIRYITLPGTAIRGEDFTPVKGMINFLPGQASATFTVPIIDHGLPGLPRTTWRCSVPRPSGLQRPPPRC